MNPDFVTFDNDVEKNISFRKLDYDRDLTDVFLWMHQQHVIPFWQLNLPFSKFSRHLKDALDDRHQTLYIGEIDGHPMSYWEAYWVKEDVVEKCYEAEPFDQGIHLLIGDPQYLGRGYALPLLRAMVGFQFKRPETKKVVAEPDIRNEKMIHVFEKCGFEAVHPIELPDKTGLLMFCHRETFEKRWSHAGFYQEV
ncbi:rhizobactin siderophore biosynthesis protein RhbD [Thalassobacillus devorans]|uniref:Lysine N-acyltransferase MbtK n=1 Tax=Thalassobacillus devorans TaxID=279813 RepID=A0ABQ1PV05_9BACI|nr:GNAT family N-acetyltransferase [Thalassobacillus devorans]NIK30842.1 RimJ/RimL family protein N-acetyltransferase [Thalassobacillus devorans]GGD04711.1 rhizobactin siderophore biosynthesis protein RhbD [Thalassobacillus devorans]